jgi:hypothetical protein
VNKLVRYASGEGTGRRRKARVSPSRRRKIEGNFRRLAEQVETEGGGGKTLTEKGLDR